MRYIVNLCFKNQGLQPDILPESNDDINLHRVIVPSIRRECGLKLGGCGFEQSLLFVLFFSNFTYFLYDVLSFGEPFLQRYVQMKKMYAENYFSAKKQ